MIRDKKITWMDISYGQLRDIRDAASIEYENEKLFAIMQAIYGDDVLDLSLLDFNKLAGNIGELAKPIPNDLTVKGCSVNGREYYFDGLLGKLTAAQWQDFHSYVKNNDEAKSFSVFFIPKGHTYNDGYDMLQVFKDIEDVPAPILLSATFFFNRQLTLFSRIFQSSLRKRLKKMKNKKIMESIANLE